MKPDENLRNCWRNCYSTRKRQEILNKLRQVLLLKWSTIKWFNWIKIFDKKKWVEVNDLSSGQYFVNKNISFKTSMLRSDICDYSNAYVVVKGTIAVGGNDDNKKRDKNTIL